MSPPAAVDFKSINIGNWPQHLSQKFVQFLDKESHFDIYFVFESGEKVGAHKLVVLASTEFFTRYECQNNEVRMPSGIEPHEFIALLRFMYTGKILINKSNCSNLLHAANIIELNSLASRLEPYIKDFAQSDTPFRFETSVTKRNLFQTLSNTNTDEVPSKSPRTDFDASESSTPSSSIISKPSTTVSVLPNRLTTTKVLQKYEETCPSEEPKTPSLTHKITQLVGQLLKDDPNLFVREPEIKLRLVQRNEISKTDQIRYATVRFNITDGKNQLRIQLDPILDPVAPQGPFTCHRCFNADRSKLTFSTYYGCRYHHETVHKIKFNPLTCQHCGNNFKRKVNFIYHKFMKHGIPPIKPFNFPKCTQCNYFALNGEHLDKHVQDSHGSPTEEPKQLNSEDESQHFTLSLDQEESRTLARQTNVYGSEFVPQSDEDFQPIQNQNESSINANTMMPDTTEIINIALPVISGTNGYDLSGIRPIFVVASGPMEAMNSYT